MTKQFGAESTTDEVLEGVNLSGKRILVTGASAGLGVETARTLAAHGATVVGAARDLDKAKQRHRNRPQGCKERRQPRADRARSRLAQERARLRRCAGESRQAVRRRDLQCGRDGVSERQDVRRFRDAVRHQSSGPFRAGEPDRVADEEGFAAGESFIRRPSLLRRRSSTIPISSTRPIRSSAPMAAPRRRTSCSRWSSTGGTKAKAFAPPPCIPAEFKPNSADT